MKRIYLKVLVTAFIFFLTVALFGAKEDKMLYKNSNVPVEHRVSDLLKRMTLDEKISQMCMTSLSRLKFDNNGNVSEGG